MSDPSSAATEQNLQLTLRLELRLSRCGPESAWHGEVSIAGRDERLCFPTLPALIAWIARLEPLPHTGGIR